jgi:hypothetical protein
MPEIDLSGATARSGQEIALSPERAGIASLALLLSLA